MNILQIVPHLVSALSFIPSADGRPSADTAAQPVEVTLRSRRAWTMAAFGGGECRCSPAGNAVPTARGKRGKGHRMVPFPPLDSPKPSFAPRRPSVARRNGGYRSTIPGVFQLMGRFIALNLLCVICRAYQCAARRCRAFALSCEKLRFHQWCALGAPNVPVGPSLLDARPKGVASQGKVGESRGAGKPWCPCPFCLRRETPAIPPPPGGGNPPPCHGEHPPARKGQSRLHRLRRCIGGKAYRRQTVKSTKTRRVR